MNPSEEEEENNNINTNCYELGPIYLHRWIDCQDEYDKWYEAQIIDISPSNNNNIKVHYKGWKSKFDTWIDLNSEPERARLLHTFTDKPPKLGQLETYAVGTKCDCLDSTDKWYEAEIMEENDNGELVRIHYKGWDSKYDEWINKDSYRIAPLHTMTSSSSSSQQTPSQSQSTSTTAQRVASSITVSPSSKKRKGSKPKNNVSIVRKPKFQRNKSDASNSSVRVHRNTSIGAYTSGDDDNMNHNVHVLSDTDHDYKKIEEPSTTLIPATTTEIKDEDNDDDDIDDDGGGGANNNSNNGTNGANKADEAQISSEQYLRNFKPSLRDEQQFEAKLAMKGLQIVSMGEDGNCLFRSISHQVYGKEDFHMILRQKCVQYLQSEYEYFGSYVPGGHDRQIFDQYCTRMQRNGIWGDNLEIQAFSEIYGRSIEIYAYDDKPMKTFSNKPADDANKDQNDKNNDNDNSNNADDDENHLNLGNDHQQQPKREKPPIRLSYHCNSHYNSIIHPQLHRLSLLDESKVGEVENEKIRLSYLRSVHANQSTVLLSDIEATDLAYFQQALKESRKMFEDNNLNQSAGNQQLDEVIKKSLAQYEQDTLDQAKQLSMKEQEDMDLRKAIAISQFDFGTFGGNHPENDGNNDAPDNHPNGNFNIDNYSNLAGVDGNYIIKQVVDRGYTLDQATMAWTVFESQKDQFSQQTLIQKMIDYIQNITFSQNFYNLQ